MNLIDITDKSVINVAKKNWLAHQPKRGFNCSEWIVENKGKYEGRCTRAMVYEFMGVEPLWEYTKPLNYYRAQFGDVVETFIIDLLKQELPWKIERQKRFEVPIKELHRPLVGRIDDILTFWEEGKEVPTKAICLEIKSTHGRKFTNKAFGLKENGPDEMHLYQLGLYKKYFPYPDWPNVEFVLLYFSREDFNRLYFVDGMNMNLPTEFDWGPFMRVEDYIERKVLPPRNFKTNPDKGKDEFPCSWCAYVGTCYELTSNL